MKKHWSLWSIPIALGYLYAITILTQYGYYSYFNIPTNFIDASIPNNVLFGYSLIKVIWELLAEMPWWKGTLIGAGIALAVVLSHHFFHDRKLILAWIGTGFAILFLSTSYSLGTIIAKAKTNFLVLSPECSTVGPAARYIIPDLYEGKAILVPIDPISRKLQNGIVLRDLSSLPCGIENQEVGVVTK